MQTLNKEDLRVAYQLTKDPSVSYWVMSGLLKPAVDFIAALCPSLSRETIYQILEEGA